MTGTQTQTQTDTTSGGEAYQVVLAVSDVREPSDVGYGEARYGGR